MSCHNHFRTVIDGGPERDKFTCFQFIICFIDGRKTGMTVRIGVSVPRKMLQRGYNTGSLHSFQKSNSVFGHNLRIIRERTDTDNRIRCIIINIQNRCKIRVDSECLQFVSVNGCHFLWSPSVPYFRYRWYRSRLWIRTRLPDLR